MKLKAVTFLLVLILSKRVQCSEMNRMVNSTLYGLNENTTDISMTSRNRTSAGSEAILSEAYLRYLSINFALTGIYLPIILTIGVLGNSITVVLLYRGVLKSSSSIYLIGLSISDLLYLITCIPWVFTVYTSVSDNPTWKAFYSYYVAYFLSFVNIQYTTSVWIIVAFTVKRLVVVTFPFKSKHSSSTKRSKIVVATIYMVGICFNIPLFFIYTVVTKVDPKTNEEFLIPELTRFGSNPSFITTNFWLSFVFNILLPFIIMGTLNIAIVIKLATARRNALSLNSTHNRNPRDNQITRLLFAIVVAFFVCNSLSAVLHVMHALGDDRVKTFTFRALTVAANSLLTTNTVINFILYATCSSAMRHALMNMLCNKRKKKSQNGVASTISATLSSMN